MPIPSKKPRTFEELLESNLKNAGPDALPPSPNRVSPSKASRPKPKKEFLRRKTPTSNPAANVEAKKYRYYAQNFDTAYEGDKNSSDVVDVVNRRAPEQTAQIRRQPEPPVQARRPPF
jgi:hypothetical protein